MTKKLSTLILIFAFALTSKAQSDYEKQTQAFAKDLATKIKEIKKLKVTVSDFLDNEDNVTELGRSLAEDIAVNLVNEAKGDFQVMERTSINAILKEQKLASTGLIDPETAKKLGKLKAVDAVIMGKITFFGNSYRVTIKVVDAETLATTATTSGNLAGSDDIKKLFDKKIILGNTTNAPSVSTTTTQQDTKTTSNKQDEITNSRNQNGCEGDANNGGWEAFGDYCFTNNTKIDMVVLVHYHYKTFGSDSKDVKLLIKPSETKCVYSAVVENQYKYPNTFKVFKKEDYKDEDESSWWVQRFTKNTTEYDSGTFQTIKCKTITYTIK